MNEAGLKPTKGNVLCLLNLIEYQKKSELCLLQVKLFNSLRLFFSDIVQSDLFNPSRFFFRALYLHHSLETIRFLL